MVAKLKINHLYSKNLNIYGDIGNIIAMEYRAKIHGIEVEIFSSEIGDKFETADIYLIGGGQDKDQMLVFKDLLTKKSQIEKEVNRSKVFLLICGGYQLFGKYFLDAEGEKIDGLGILDLETKAPDNKVSSRCIGNIIVEMNKEFISDWEIDAEFSKFLVGFENHGGQTFFNTSDLKSIGKSVKGFGNNSIEKKEGCSYRSILGTYLHGSILPKNPHLTDAILKKALKNKDMDHNFKKNYSSFEGLAHENIVKKYLK